MKLKGKCFFVLLGLLMLNACNPSSTQGPLYHLLPASHTNIIFQQQLEHDPLDITGLGSGGNGLAVGDINKDGLPDILFTGGTAKPALYLNKGNLQFEDITATSGIDDFKDKGKTLGVVMADVNGDGLLDYYILKGGIQGNADGTYFSDYGGNLLYINLGNLTFQEQSKAYNLNIIGTTNAASFFDYDNDGDLDLYLENFPETGRTFDFEFYKKPPRLKWYADMFMENTGNKFEDVTAKAGILFERSLGQSVSIADVNNDGWQDIFVANDFYGRDFLYINNGNKTFTESGKDYFAVGAMSAMGTDFADINQDGYPDLFVGEMMPEGNYRQKLNLAPFSLEIYNQLTTAGMPQYTRNMLYLNNGGQGFFDIGLFAGVEATEWSWGSIFGDMDNDGLMDLFVANGIKRDMTNMDFIRNQYGGDIAKSSDPKMPLSTTNAQSIPSVVTPNFAFKNMGNLSFTNMQNNWGLNTAVHSRAAVLADLDNDGDLDLVLNNIDTIPFVYQNNSNTQTNFKYLKVRLIGAGKNTQGIGTKVTLYSNGKGQSSWPTTTKGFSTSPDPILHFGLNNSDKIDSLRVVWPGGNTQILYNVKNNILLNIFEKDAKPVTLSSLPTKSYFNDVTTISGVDYKHIESNFNDFKNYRIHHRKLSAEGPPIATGDIDGDGLVDFYIGGAKGNQGILYKQVGTKLGIPQFKPTTFADRNEYEDMAATFFDANGDGHLDLLIASGSIEFEENSPYLQPILYLNDGAGNFTPAPNALPTMLTSIASVVAEDYDKDGDMDLFLGGRMLQTGYPKAPRSYLLQNNKGKFVDVTETLAPNLATVGMVTDALWTDYDNDGYKDLMLVGEWMPITVFKNQLGKSFERLVDKNLDESHGWWNTLTAADLDNDGFMDYVAGNWGENTFFKADNDKPVWLYANDFDQNGTIDPIVFRNYNGVIAPFVNRDLFCSQMPAYNNQYYTFERYAKATLDNMFDDGLKQNSLVLKATQLRTSIIKNTGGKSFALNSLPPVAQLAPIFAIECLDVNGDGHMDIVMGGNTTANHYECGATYGIQGVVLLGNGKLVWQAINNAESGLNIPYEAKSMVLINHNSTLPILLVGNTNRKMQVIGLKKQAKP